MKQGAVTSRDMVQRFSFGKNWKAYLSTLDDERIHEAETSLRKMLGLPDLSGKRFLDIGSGSGLFSLAARRLGATVHSFDYDPESVECAQALKLRYFPDDLRWTIERGSVLDIPYMENLGTFDIVYSWGTLHHTGNLEQALDNAAVPVADKGLLYIAIYNDQGSVSRFWKAVKKTYCSGWIGRALVGIVFLPLFLLAHVLSGLMESGNPFSHFTTYKRNRGMSIYYDWIDWLGGYPFEVARPEKIFLRYKSTGFSLENLRTKNGIGCNEFVFRKSQKRQGADQRFT